MNSGKIPTAEAATSETAFEQGTVKESKDMQGEEEK